ncbi:uncharacterized protein H6S33_001368 [Morchella sextelata]|uniref:uncharacterized protein n=1 Tax=Morchella sextelata TaxID=1174677 RepID=UPI001D03CC46|nr:uncharacterized protein H6S33_001368 [Morchella sextelata]KAH0609140.1 hypothetical protein H6S33_001368 [Morchella sextelata]
MTDPEPANDSNTFMMPLGNLTEKDFFQMTLDKWCILMDLEQLRSPILMEDANTAFKFDMSSADSSTLPGSSTLRRSYTLNSTIKATGPRARDPRIFIKISPIHAFQVPDTSNFKEINVLKERWYTTWNRK